MRLTRLSWAIVWEHSATSQKLIAWVSWTFSAVQLLGELPSTVGGVATAVAIFNRAAAMEPSNARVRQQRGACKDTLGDHTGGIENLSAAIQLGLDNALTYRYRGLANLQLG